MAINDNKLSLNMKAGWLSGWSTGDNTPADIPDYHKTTATKPLQENSYRLVERENTTPLHVCRINNILQNLTDIQDVLSSPVVHSLHT